MAKALADKHKAGQNSRGWPWIAVVLVLAVVLGWLYFMQTAQPAAKGLPAEIGLSEALAKRNSGAFILDVREPEEWREYHVPNSTLIPLGTLEARVNELPRDKELVVVCRSGNRSATGRDILKKAGFTQVTSLAGGLSQWKAAGYPTVSGP